MAILGYIFILAGLLTLSAGFIREHAFSVIAGSIYFIGGLTMLVQSGALHG